MVKEKVGKERERDCVIFVEVRKYTTGLRGDFFKIPAFALPSESKPALRGLRKTKPVKEH